MSSICKTCGGQVSRIGNYYVCEFCGNKWEIDSGNDVHAVDRANAWAALRDGDFEKAAELFENIIIKEAENHEAYWGRALSLSGIVYVTDLNENKKVPTCNNISEKSFVNDKDVQKAISLAPADIADSYRQQAEYIEKVRTEWLEKASKEPAYDVFISFKDSDRENGIERTQDSIDAQDLYNALVAEGYKVFFSRISLRDKISEQYEPYIYNAIKTAKVMIVFGEKAEYFSSVWIKNEWSRFKTRIEKGEKHKNSLVVVYKNLNPGELPVILKSRQCLNASDMTFLSDLTRHIKRVVEESKQNVHLEKIEITGGQFAKKASTLSVNSVQTREVGAGAIADTSISEKQSISLIYSYLGEQQWQEAMSLVDDVLFDNPGCAEALWCKLLITYQVSANDDLAAKLDRFSAADYENIEKILNCASKDFAEKILTFLYRSEKNVSGSAYKKILDTILPYSFSKRQSNIDLAFEGVIERSKYEAFVLLLHTLKSTDVDKYIIYNYKYATTTTVAYEKHECLSNILTVDEGNIEALRAMVLFDLENFKPIEIIVKDFETLLKYSPAANKEIVSCFQWLCIHLNNDLQCRFAKQLLRYYNGEISDLKDLLVKLTYRAVEQGQYIDEVEYFLNLILSFDANNPDAYWALCLLKVRANTEDEIKYKPNLLKDVPEFNRYLALVDDARRKKCISISREQTELRRLADLRKRIEKAHGRLLAAGTWHTVGVKADGTVVATGSNGHGECNVDSWRNIVAVAAGIGFTVGLREDGTVVATGSNDEGQCNVNSWRDIVDICAQGCWTLGLKKDGTVVVAGGKENFGPGDVTIFKDIVAISTGTHDTVGIKSDGTVVNKREYRKAELKEWKDIVAVACGDLKLGLKYDGTICTNSRPFHRIQGPTDWSDVIAIAAEDGFYMGLKADGTIVAHGHASYIDEVQKWTNIVAFAPGSYHTVGLKANGTVVAAGDDTHEFCNVNHWRLFNDIDTLDTERQAAKEAAEMRRKEEEERWHRRNAGRCQHCGGELKGLFRKKCISCGKPKDY